MRILVAIFSYNEGEKLQQSLSRHKRKRNYDLLIMDDGSTDKSTSQLPGNVILLRNPENQGIGAAMKSVFDYTLQKRYDIIVIQAGNNKDNPDEIPALLKPILGGKADFVQGSRFLPKGYYGNTPFYRILATKIIHPLLVSIALRKRVTDSTNGFRAFRSEILLDKKLNWHQQWLDKYELEPYILFKAISLGYRYVEVPVSKIYPPKALGYTKMKPIVGWWSIVRPIFYLWFGLKS